MDKGSVAIIISTYNGRKYIEDQLESILSQTYDNITIFIRDDGSTDGTLEVVESLKLDNPTAKKIEIIHDDLGNLGFADSFKLIISQIDGFEYYSLCDQDDVWLEDKIESAVCALDKYEKTEPTLYSCGYWICDDLLNKKSMSKKIKIDDYTLGHVFMEGLVPGFTMVFNDKLKTLAFNNLREEIASHDKWLATIIVGLKDNFVYDVEPHVLYRRHKNTASATNQLIFDRILWKINHIVKGAYFENTNNMIRLYKVRFGESIKDECDIKFVEVFSGKSKIKKLFFRERLREKKIDEIALRLLYLLK